MFLYFCNDMFGFTLRYITLGLYRDAGKYTGSCFWLVEKSMFPKANRDLVHGVGNLGKWNWIFAKLNYFSFDWREGFVGKYVHMDVGACESQRYQIPWNRSHKSLDPTSMGARNQTWVFCRNSCLLSHFAKPQIQVFTCIF